MNARRPGGLWGKPPQGDVAGKGTRNNDPIKGVFIRRGSSGSLDVEEGLLRGNLHCHSTRAQDENGRDGTTFGALPLFLCGGRSSECITYDDLGCPGKS